MRILVDALFAEIQCVRCEHNCSYYRRLREAIIAKIEVLEEVLVR